MLLRAVGMVPGSHLLSIEVEPPTRTTDPWLRRLLSLSLKVKGLTVGQFPNAPLAIAFVGGLVSRSTSGAVHDATGVVAVGATAVWAFLELVYGVNWFRHVLGLYSLVGIAMVLAGL
jgi:hypothetical protein